MDHYVFDEGGFDHHGAPVEAEGSVGGAAGPAGLLITYQHPAWAGQAEPGSPAVHDFGQAGGGAGAVPLHNRFANGFVAFLAGQASWHGDAEAPMVEADLG